MKNGDQPINPVRSQALEGGHTDSGLTKREYFAAMAMQGWIACQSVGFSGDSKEIAKRAIACADELLKQLEQ